MIKLTPEAHNALQAMCTGDDLIHDRLADELYVEDTTDTLPLSVLDELGSRQLIHYHQEQKDLNKKSPLGPYHFDVYHLTDKGHALAAGDRNHKP